MERLSKRLRNRGAKINDVDITGSCGGPLEHQRNGDCIENARKDRNVARKTAVSLTHVDRAPMDRTDMQSRRIAAPTPLDGEIAERIEDLAEVLSHCERNYALYPGSTTVQHLRRLESTCFDFCKEMTHRHKGGYLVLSIVKDELQALISKVREISVAIEQEVEYQHRLEQRNAHKTLLRMEHDQQKMLTTMQTQEKILASLAEERRLVTMMKEQQLILQTVQQLQMSISKAGMDFNGRTGDMSEVVATPERATESPAETAIEQGVTNRVLVVRSKKRLFVRQFKRFTGMTE